MFSFGYFSINLLKQEANKRNFNCHYDVLPNGYDIKSIKEIVKRKREAFKKYAVTIGTYKYKKIKVGRLQEKKIITLFSNYNRYFLLIKCNTTTINFYKI